MIPFVTSAFTWIKSMFSPKNIKWVIIIAILLLLIGIIYFQSQSNGRLERKIEVLTKTNEIYKNNIKVLNEQAVEWKNKDSLNTVTVGLLSADKELWKGTYSSLNTKFNNLILDYNKKVKRETYLETQIIIKDSVISTLKAGDTSRDGSFIANDSTIRISQTNRFDSVNYRSIIGDIKIGIDSNKIKSADIRLESTFGLGINIATYRDKDGVPRVSVGTKYPGINLSVSGITDVERELAALKKKALEKSAFGIGLSVGYGYTIGSNYTLQKGAFIGVGLSWTPKFLRFNK